MPYTFTIADRTYSYIKVSAYMQIENIERDTTNYCFKESITLSTSLFI